MHLINLFESTNEGYTVTRGIDKERYQERQGLEGPFQTKSGKVVYYDKKEGKYYDPDTDMYIDHDDYRKMDESQLAEMFESVYGSPLFDDKGEVASNTRTQRILNLMRAKHPQAKNDLEALLLSFENGQKQDRQDIGTLYQQNRDEEADIDALEKQLQTIKQKRGMTTESLDTREVNRLGRVLMHYAKKTTNDTLSARLGRVGSELALIGDPSGALNMQDLSKRTMEPESVILAMMDKAKEYKGGDPAVTSTPDPEKDEEVEEGYQDSLKNKIGRASDEFDIGTDNWEVKIDGKPWKVFRNKASATKAAHTIEMKYGKKTTVFATRKPASKGVAEDFDTNFKKRIGYTVRGGAASDMMKKQAAQAQADNPDAGKGLGPAVLDIPKARRNAAKRGIRAPSNLRSSPNTRDPKRLPEEARRRTSVLDGDDIKIGDVVQTLKMGQMQGTVTGFTKKGGVDKVMFKHKSGKTYATVPENLLILKGVEESVKKSESQVAENIDLRHNLKPGTYKHKLQNIQVSIDDNGSVTFMQPAQWEIEGDQEYLEYVESQLAMPEYWDAELDEAKKKPVPTKPDKWAYAKAEAKKKFDVYPSAYANAWAAKKYKELGGGWRMGKPKK